MLETGPSENPDPAAIVQDSFIASQFSRFVHLEGVPLQ